MKRFLIIGLFCIAAPACAHFSGGPAARPELVMAEGDRITATTSAGKIEIVAGKGLKRTYTWEGGSRSATLGPRTERWDGGMGAYFPGGPGNHWKDHHGIGRGVLEEGQQHFRTESEALRWIKVQSGYYPTMYSEEGLVVSFGKVLERRQINVEVWQIFINGKKPTALPRAIDEKPDFQPSGARLNSGL